MSFRFSLLISVIIPSNVFPKRPQSALCIERDLGVLSSQLFSVFEGTYKETKLKQIPLESIFIKDLELIGKKLYF
ncbi:hypothetical protein BpHYR1_045348 [Brachionus plicatilis]|uniref:Uncharacterized protein n=1 Tax=Brachionus plicatilis TaxID=10195 RepID=A0A3M7RNS0_BRAPC|nr:hypothetical protein BpHYR1_045348 [Brachionus plicatilis]